MSEFPSVWNSEVWNLTFHCIKFFVVSCKPLNDREHNFYRTLPLVLHPYTPKFEGIMSVALHEDENGYITLMGTPPNCYGLKQNRFVTIAHFSRTVRPKQNRSAHYSRTVGHKQNKFVV